MSVSSGFFDSVSGDRVYNAEQMSNYFDGIVSDGVFENVGNRLLVRPASGQMKVTVDTGRALIRCHWFKNDDIETLTLDPSDMQLNRIDAIALRLDMNSREITLHVKRGTPAQTPTMPEITRNDEVYELYIASVLVNRGAASPTSVTDLRPSSYCGWVTGVIKQVDTSDLFNQFLLAYTDQYEMFKTFCETKEAQFDAWFRMLTEQLTVQSGVMKYEDKQTFSGGYSVMLNHGDISGFDPSKDILLLYRDGKYLTEGTDYTVERAPLFGYIASLTEQITAPTVFQKVVLRNTIGQSVLVAIDATVTMNAAAIGQVTDATFDE